MERRPSSVLFACTTNTVRSVMAEGLLKTLHGRHLYVDSCGARTAEPNPFATAVMEEIGIDISRHRPKTFDDLEDGSFDLVITLSPEAQHKAVELTRTSSVEIAFWNTFDPTAVHGTREQRLAAFREVRDTLYRRILVRFPVGAALD